MKQGYCEVLKINSDIERFNPKIGVGFSLETEILDDKGVVRNHIFMSTTKESLEDIFIGYRFILDRHLYYAK